MAETATRRPGRNQPCHCGSGRKYKHCCLPEDEETDRRARAEQAPTAEATPAPAEPEAHARPSPPPRAAGQPWKRAAQNAWGARRINTPRKAG